MSGPTVTDMFCGAGGSSLGAAMAGADLALGLNHWRLAIDTHQTNFQEAAHDVCDVSATDPRRYRRTDVLIASPECTNHSLAKGATRKSTEPNLLDEGDPSAERSRATMWDVVRFAEHHQYEAVVVENVVDARSWRLFDAWWHAMTALGYDGKSVYLNSMHAGVGQVPQSRDRMYVVWWRKGRTAPNVDIRPPAPCMSCQAWVWAVQSWRRADRAFGKYRQQYDYRCPDCAAAVHPPVLPAAAAIDWTLPAPRIGDRNRPLATATVERIRRGLQRYARHMLVQVGGSTFERGDSLTRLRPLDGPMRTQTGTLAEALVTTAPFIVEMHGGGSSTRALADPLATVLAGGNHHGLVVPCGGTWNDGAKPTDEPLPTMLTRDALGFALVGQNMANNVPKPAEGHPAPNVCTGANLYMVAPPLIMRNNGSGGTESGWQSTPTDEPMRTITTAGHQSLIVPYNRTGDAKPVGEPVGTLTSRDRFALVIPTERGRHGASKRARGSDEPLATQTTRQTAGVVPCPVPQVEDCGFRMLQPHEIRFAMRMEARPDGAEYVVLGNKRDQVAQLGNAVTPPAMQLLMAAVMAHLETA